MSAVIEPDQDGHYHWNGVEEAEWMRPPREFVDSLNELTDLERSKLHEYLNYVYGHALAEAEETSGEIHKLRLLLGDRP